MTSNIRSFRMWLLTLGAVIVCLGIVHTVVVADEDGNADFFIHLPAIVKEEIPVFCGTQPLLLAPDDGAVLDTLNPTFRWTNTNDPDASQVRRELATDAAFQNIVSITTTGPSDGEREFTYIWRNLDAATVYYWRMVITCGSVDGPPSETRSFTTGSGGTILPAPSLISPADNSTVTLPVTFSWQPVAGTIEYLLTVTYPFGGQTIFQVDDTSFVWPYFDAGESYTWHVAARNSYAIGVPSEERTFTISTALNSLQPPLAATPAVPVAEDGDGNRLFESR